MATNNSAQERDPRLRAFKNPDDSKIINDKGEVVGSGLSPNLPLPNIVRIEALNKIARNRYLGTIQKISSNVRDQVALSLKKNNLDKFYGFMKGNAPKTLSIGSQWVNSSSTGGTVGFIRNLVGGGGVSAGGSGRAFDDLFGLARDVTGISASSTGASTMKRFNTTGLSEFTINCGWYLPEQYLTCVKSLKSILAMTYPVQIGKISATDVANILLGTADTIIEGGSEAISKIVGVFYSPDSSSSDSEQELAELSDEERKAREEAEKQANIKKIDDEKRKVEDNRSMLKKFSDNTDLTKVADIFGRNLTFDPVPVRCSVGQYVDLEPLVITKLGIEFSNDTFINEDGRHLPLFCSVSITMDFWLIPAPKLQFMSLLGTEMFGDK